ncbi:Transcription initiation factor IIB [Psilocybe cubensis]|uniref:Transcription initiation factor IIB n=2 Tax=Psilocybe cubensis TaxID=181762 RepID=A0ACB8H8L6_PSICU|nr:Transcription initiation factor IIB [Psilocybe cubensis]KAH9483987.1 Transcription initiation factor IIB [Psilocybe cubensis]
MSAGCLQCSASTVWDASVASAVCTSCGSLADPSQSLLSSSSYLHQNDTLEPSLWDPSASTTLKSLRTRNNWDLAGQGKESRDRKNSYAIAEFIKSLAVSLNASGLSPRATTLFNQVKSASSFRWGKKSRAVAAACLAIALRESSRPDSLHDIALIADVPPTSISRQFMAITSALGLSLPFADPSVHMSTLQAHIASAIHQDSRQDSSLPSTLVNSLGNVCLRSAANIATALGQTLARLCPDHDVLRLPTPPTACGIFILALEAEKRAVFNPLSDLAQYLGTPNHVSKNVVMARYKSIQDIIATWIAKIPWLEKYENKNGRAKNSKRLIVARGLKDAIKFHEDLFQQKSKPSLELDLEVEEEEDNCNQSSGTSPPPSKRPRLSSPMSHAAQFLLDPTGTSLSSHQERSTSSLMSYLPLAGYILASRTGSPAFQAPTRLQLLAHDRGGVDEAHIPDEDLFVEGELEKLIRPDSEISTLREKFGWLEDEDENNLHNDQQPGRKKYNASGKNDEILHGTPLNPRKKSRLNLEALALFMAERHHEDNGPDLSENTFNDNSFEAEDNVLILEDEHRSTIAAGLDASLVDDDDDLHSADETTTSNAYRRYYASLMSGDTVAQEADFALENWSPPTLDHIVSDSRYQEEYD